MTDEKKVVGTKTIDELDDSELDDAISRYEKRIKRLEEALEKLEDERDARS